MSDNTSEANDQPENQPADPPPSGVAPWSLMESTTLEGKLGVVICWYFDGNFEDVPTDRAMVRRLLRCAQWYLEGHIHRLTFNDLLRLHDAVCSYPRPDADLDRVGSDLFKRWHKLFIAYQATPHRPAVEDALAEVPTATLEKLTGMFQGEIRRRTSA